MGLSHIIRYSMRHMSSKITQHQTELMKKGLPTKKPIDDVKSVVIVASGKGGVGKSTTAVNLAVSLAVDGINVGLLDADVFGPSIPLMMNLKEQPLVDNKNLIIPPVNYGVKCLSMGLLVDVGPIVWRGPLVMSALQKLIRGAKWGPLDVLLVDTPPGTGDVHLSLIQNIPITGVVLVSTPQRAALDVTLRGAEMYKMTGVRMIGLVENMKYVMCNNCGSQVNLHDNVTESYLNNLGTDVLASIPIEPNVSPSCDQGMPLIIKKPMSNSGLFSNPQPRCKRAAAKVCILSPANKFSRLVNRTALTPRKTKNSETVRKKTKCKLKNSIFQRF